ncbi:hypothetical protein ACFL0R_00450 [Pseudomonadota bacterium]
MNTETFLLLLPAIQVGIAATAVALSVYWLGSCLFARFTHKSCS